MMYPGFRLAKWGARILQTHSECQHCSLLYVHSTCLAEVTGCFPQASDCHQLLSIKILVKRGAEQREGQARPCKPHWSNQVQGDHSLPQVHISCEVVRPLLRSEAMFKQDQ